MKLDGEINESFKIELILPILILNFQTMMISG
jgi:hypothetical protein